MSDPSSTDGDLELQEDHRPIVGDTGSLAKASHTDLRDEHGRGGIMRTDRFEVHSDDNV